MASSRWTVSGLSWADVCVKTAWRKINCFFLCLLTSFWIISWLRKRNKEGVYITEQVQYETQDLGRNLLHFSSNKYWRVAPNFVANSCLSDLSRTARDYAMGRNPITRGKCLRWSTPGSDVLGVVTHQDWPRGHGDLVFRAVRWSLTRSLTVCKLSS